MVGYRFRVWILVKGLCLALGFGLGIRFCYWVGL